MRQILLIALLLLIVDVLSLNEKREDRLNDEETAKRPIKSREDNKAAPVGKTASPGSRDEDEGPVQKIKPADQVKGAGVFGRTGKTRIDGKSPSSQPDGDAVKPEDKNPQSVPDGTKYGKKKSKSAKDATEPIDKRTNPDGDGDKPARRTSQSDGDSGEPKKLPRKGEAGPSVERPNDGGEKPDKESLPSEKQRKSTSDDSKSNPDKSENPKVAENEVDDENDDDGQGDQKPGTVVPPKGDKPVKWSDEDEEEEIQLRPMENAIAQESVRTIGKVGRPTETSSSSSFVTYFIIAVVIVIVIYLLLHNKKKLMAYVIEGRNTGRVRRNRGTSGAEYKPLNNPEELTTGCRTESA